MKDRSTWAFYDLVNNPAHFEYRIRNVNCLFDPTLMVKSASP